MAPALIFGQPPNAVEIQTFGISSAAQIVAFDGFTDVDVFLPWDLLNRVDAPGWKVRILADAPSITSIAGLSIATHGRLEEAARADAVIIASGPGLRPKLQGTEFAGALSFDPPRQRIGSMCSGALLLASKGLLEGKRATTYPTQRDRLASMSTSPSCARARSRRAAGCLAAIDLVGWIIEELAGAEQREIVLRSVQPVGRGLGFDARPLPSRQYTPQS
ncbi:Thiamine biosynthesis protein ThiJ (plasmid) [Sandaracinus amylolyticus]|nr:MULTISPECIES: DJ-1/PfpI family protein [Sandaracinus]QRN75816.1 ThiJ/PfpI domain protein [Sandaracinus sp.]UJR87343.1 Thiamine biosynthesis protein ThiJ [Sandaracinus amylolyticus]